MKCQALLQIFARNCVCGLLEDGMVKDRDSTGRRWDPAWAAAALCCRVPVVLRALGRVLEGPQGWCSWCWGW